MRAWTKAAAKYNLSVSADALPPPLVGEALAVPAKGTVSPEAPLLGELSNGVRLRGCTKGSLTMDEKLNFLRSRLAKKRSSE